MNQATPKTESQVMADKQHILFDGYPESPPFEPHPNEGIFWHYDKELNFGCWVMNQSKRPMKVPKSLEKAVKYQGHKDIYMSPLPLHKARVPNSFRAHFLWYVNEEGIGQYTYYTRTRQEDGSFKGSFLFMTMIDQD